MDKSTEKFIRKALAKIDEMSSILDARAVATRDSLRAGFPDYESLLSAAAGLISANKDRELLIKSIINFPDLDLEIKLKFIDSLHPDSATILKNTLKNKSAANGSSGGKKRSSKYQALRTEIITAYLADPQAQAAKQIDHAKNILIKHNPEFTDRMGQRTIRDAISEYRKKTL